MGDSTNPNSQALYQGAAFSRAAAFAKDHAGLQPLREPAAKLTLAANAIQLYWPVAAKAA
ncbi:MAG: hypothetical protein P4K78_08530 [Terracidiphilus sp.]|nr:hypothetical protein [Terracidiphilus sp.]